ncbi:helical backbone metal receptor [Mitsuaria sp. WAJ17]|uniref:helical backbone metal receptor n=1 Tax=Mitsuaria sp. WAJ17 TaxID=2761452 RepID=UPI002873612C|nr:helical backbone metal receptor [Mitsuaria sp. WAJ17]
MNAAPRIVSLVPSITELLIALGLRPLLVARTGFCIHPAHEVAGIPKVGGTKDVNLNKLRGLAPSHVIVNMDENRADTAEALRTFVPELIVTHPQGPQDNAGLITQLQAHFGHLPGVAARADALQRSLAQALQAARGKTWPPRRVLYLIWKDPWMGVARDTYIARMLAEVGWLSWPDALGGETGAARYPVIQGDEAWLQEIDEVLLSSEPYSFNASHLDAAQALCPRARVRLVDGELLSWYGPRAAAGLHYLMEMRGWTSSNP